MLLDRKRKHKRIVNKGIEEKTLLGANVINEL